MRTIFIAGTVARSEGPKLEPKEVQDVHKVDDISRRSTSLGIVLFAGLFQEQHDSSEFQGLIEQLFEPLQIVLVEQPG